MLMKKDRILAIISFFIPFWVYSYTLCPTVSVYADAGEFPTFAYLSGFGHPPGYPLFILILKLFLLLPFGNPAQKANLASAFLAAATIALFYLLVRRLTRDSFSAFVAGQILAFSKIYWRNALVAEVFSLLAFFSVLTFYLFYLWKETGQKKYFYWLLLAAGFGLAHHQLIIIPLFYLLIWFFWEKKWRELELKNYFLAVFLVGVGFLPYLYIWQVAKTRPLMNWENPQTLQGLWRLISRASYGTFQLTQLARAVSVPTQILGIAKMQISSFTVLGIVLALIGLFSAFRSNRKIFFYSLFIIILMSLIFPVISGMPVTQLPEIPYLERFQIIPGIFLALLAGFGIRSLRRLRLLKKEFLGVIPLLILVLNFSAVNQRGNFFGQYLAQDLLSDVDQNSIFIFEGDPEINTLFYNRYVLGQRKDITYIVGNLLIANQKWYLEEIKKFYPDLILPQKFTDPHEFLVEFIVVNSENKKVFLDIPSIEASLGIYIYKKQKGLVWEFSPEEKMPRQIPQEPKPYKNLIFKRNYPKDWPEWSLLNIYKRVNEQI